MLFCIGAFGVLIRRNPLVMFMCVELMLNAVNLTFVTFGRMLNDISGQVIVFFVLVVAAAEVVVGLGHHRGHHAAAPGRHRRRRVAAQGIADDSMVSLVWLIPALPLLGFVLLLLFGSPHRRAGVGLAGHRAWWRRVRRLRRASSSACTAGPATSYTHDLFTWISVGRFNVDIGFLLDPLSSSMFLFITGVGTLIHLYSIGYMHGDSRSSRSSSST